MALTAHFLDAVAVLAEQSDRSVTMPWPMPGNLAGFVSFASFVEWRVFMLRFNLRSGIPAIIASKFDRALKLHVLAWVDFDLIKVGELTALISLELAATDRYRGKERDRRRRLVAEKSKKSQQPVTRSQEAWIERVSFADLLKFMVEHDGLTDDHVTMNRRCGPGSTVVGRLTGKIKPSIAQIRNDLAHGYPFDSLPQAGLLELVRDLIEYAYRDMIHSPLIASSAGRG